MNPKRASEEEEARELCPKCGSDRIIPWVETTVMPKAVFESEERLLCQNCDHKFPRDMKS